MENITKNLGFCLAMAFYSACGVACHGNNESSQNESKRQIDNDRLRVAAIECDVAEFTEFMPEESKERVMDTLRRSSSYTAAKKALYLKAKEYFGDKIAMLDNGRTVGFQILEKSPRWEEILGADWATLDEYNGHKEAYHFKISVNQDWTGECKVIQYFQACLENALSCKEMRADGSVLVIKQQKDIWQLVYVDAPGAREMEEKFSSKQLDILAWAEHYFEEKKDVEYNELLPEFAETFFEKLI